MKRILSFALAMIMAFPLAACGGGTTAAAMHLRRTEGTVSVSNGEGKSLPVLDNLGLYSGYGVGTSSASYAWIDLDDVKLTKMDQNSEISIQKEGKALNVELKSGSLFFNVTEPLEDDETMNIRTSTMLVGVRGTCGWVAANDGLSQVYLLEGKVECSAEGRTVRVNAGEMAELTEDGELTVKEFPKQAIPPFVRDEADPDLTGGADDPGHPETPAPTDTPEPLNTPSPTAEPAEGVTWSLDNGTLTIGGTGPLNSVLWSDERDQVHTVIIRDGVTGIGRELFKHHDNLERITISGSVKSIGFEAFYNCRSLTEVIMLEGVASIGESAFCNCSSLTSVTIPGSVTGIGLQAFRNCTSLTDVTIPNGVTSIGGYAFKDCHSLERVNIPDGITSIESETFYNCRSLERMTIPGSVTSIGYGAFWGCRGLTDVYYGGSEGQWGEISIGDANPLLADAAIHYNS